MPTDSIVIQPKRATATQLVTAGDGPTLIVNSDLVNTVYIGNTDVITPTDPSGVVPIAPNGSIAVDGTLDFFGVILNTATPVTVYTIAGGMSTFLGLTQGGGNLAIPGIQSPNFVSNVSGWQIQQNGNAQFNNLTIRGTFFGLDFIINSSGVFIYSGTPALGNLVGSWAPASGADSFGNAYMQDFTVYNPGTTGKVNVNRNAAAGGNTGMLFYAPGATKINAAVPTQVSGRSTNTGLVNEVEVLQMTSGQAAPTNFSADLGLFSKSADGTIDSHIDMTLNGVTLNQMFSNIWNIGVAISCTLGTPTNTTLILTDGWHNVTLDPNWSNPGGAQFSYKLGIENRVFLTGALQFNVNINNNNINGNNPIPARYRPITQHFLAPAPGSAGVAINTNGVLVAAQIPGAATVFCNVDGSYPLDI